MSKFKEGDKVRLTQDLVAWDMYGSRPFVPDMLFEGYRQILNIFRDVIQIDGFSQYRYTDEMLEMAEEPMLIPSDCPEPTFFKKPHYSSLACRHKFSPIKFSR